MLLPSSSGRVRDEQNKGTVVSKGQQAPGM